MPKLILFAATTLFSRPSRRRATVAEAHAQMTCSRVATRRLRASNPHEARFDLSPLALSSRH